MFRAHGLRPCLAVVRCLIRTHAKSKLATVSKTRGTEVIGHMIFGLFRGNANRKLIGSLHGDIVKAARDPALFTDYEIEDTLEGRFESLVLHAALVLRRLKQLPPPGPDIAQDLADTLFRHFDIALREIGVADTRVPKRMKVMAEAFLGRAVIYLEAMARLPLEGPLALSQALSRNVYAGRRDGDRLARYVVGLDAALAQMTLAQILEGAIPLAAIPIAKSAARTEEMPE